MWHGLVRPVMIAVLGVLVAFGMSNFVVASNSMSVEMSQVDAMSTAMPAMDCEGESPSEPCGSETASCTLACVGPGVGLPSAPAWGRHPAILRGGGALAPSVVAGRTPPPGLPPPRFLSAV